MSDSQRWLLLTGLVGCGWLLYLLSPILMPFVAGALLAYLGDPAVDKLESWKLPRTAAVVVVFSTMTLALALIILLLIPTLEQQVNRLVGNLPRYAEWVDRQVLPWLKQQMGVEGEIIDVDRVIGILRAHWQEAGGVAATVIASISRSGVVALAWIMNLVLIPVVTFYLLRDWDVLLAKIDALLPRRVAPTVGRLAREADDVLGAFLRGQFSVMLVLAAIYSVGLSLVGLELAVLIGGIAGLISFIPYLGSIVGVLVACVAAMVQFQDFWYLPLVLAVFAVGQILEGMVLTPLFVGDRIGLHPVAVIFAVLAGGQLFGFIGILLALPVASVLMVLLRHGHDLYRGSPFYGSDG